jgi:EAL domain-containing protein (putative c-di-GMP-specific phosphodiesterase class I)
VAILTELKQCGIKILLDDFGTGHSSLAYLVRLPLNKIKIDRSFVSPAANDVASRAVTNAMIALGRTLDLEVVAEGVESKTALEFMHTQGCSQAQGFFLAHPMPGDDFKNWYLSRQEV